MTDNVLRYLLDDLDDELRVGVSADANTPDPDEPCFDLAAVRRRRNARSAEEVAGLILEIDRLRLGEHALSLGRGYVDIGDLDSARHWFSVAIDYETPDAARALVDVIAAQEARAE